MRTWKLISGVGVAIVAAWLAVTNLAYAAELACRAPWSGDTDCQWPNITIPARGVLVIEVYTIQVDGKDIDRPAEFTIFDTNNNNVKVHTMFVGARSTGSWMYENTEAPLVAKVRVNHPQLSDVVVRGGYSIK